jgi:hypothetical protein
VKTQRELAAERRREKLAVVKEQAERGMVTRKMTAREREEHPPRPRDEKARRGWTPLSP